jgi:cell division protein FtsB
VPIIGRRNRPDRGPRPVVTGRALVLGALVIVLVVVLAAPLHRYLSSRSGVSTAAQQLRDDQNQLAALKKQQAQWGDPGYIQQQARLRLQYAMPGDTVYVVTAPGQASDLGETATAKDANAQPPGSTWNSRLWGSIQSADAAP